MIDAVVPTLSARKTVFTMGLMGTPEGESRPGVLTCGDDATLMGVGPR